MAATTLLMIRLVPVDPVDPTKFKEYLEKLDIKAYDLTVDDSVNGVLLGEASGRLDINTPVEIDTSGTVPKLKQSIIQHFVTETISQPPLPDETNYLPQSVATAVIAVDIKPLPPPAPPVDHLEYPTKTSYDLRLELKNGDLVITDDTIDYNITAITINGPLPVDPAFYAGSVPSSIVSLPQPDVGLSSDIAHVDLKPDGSLPKFSDLVVAIDLVLKADHPLDDNGVSDLAHREHTLTAAQSKQIASEIIWNRALYPPPISKSPLEFMYTAPVSTDNNDKINQDRKQFEGDLTAYHATHDATATRLAPLVFAVSAAIYAEKKSAIAPLAGFAFPVETDTVPPPGMVFHSGAIVLTNGGTTPLDPSFVVPAAYFFALAARFPTTLTEKDRYGAALTNTEARLNSDFNLAVDSGTIKASEATITLTGTQVAITAAQAARRINALSSIQSSQQIPLIPLQPPLTTLIQDWLKYEGVSETINDGFWKTEISNNQSAYLSLLLLLVTNNSTELITSIQSTFNLQSAKDLASITDLAWRNFFKPAAVAALLPAFTIPGTASQRTEAYIQYLKRFFAIVIDSGSTLPPGSGSVPTIAARDGDLLQKFLDAFGGSFNFKTPPNDAAIDTTIATIFANDPQSSAWLKQALRTISDLYQLVSSLTMTEAVRFSCMEALYARGFTSTDDVLLLSQTQFHSALAGTVAFDTSDQIYTALETSGPSPDPEPGNGFLPVNSGSLVDCIPPPHLSPLGPVEYLHEMLQESDGAFEIGTIIAGRRGPLGDLHATQANLETPLPLLDLVNESLEALGSNAGTTKGAVYDTNGQELAGIALGHGPSKADPAAMYAALPEHSSPAVPVKQPAIYDALKNTFTGPSLPYDQPLDVNRSYLRHVGTSRFETMRHFHRDITELAIDSEHEPADFQRHQWRYPVRFDIALEYLQISSQEYTTLYSGTGTLDEALIKSLLGYTAPQSEDESEDDWLQDILSVQQFMDRTGLTYCEFLDLWRSQFVAFSRSGQKLAIRLEESDGSAQQPERDLATSLPKADGATITQQVVSPAREQQLANLFPDCKPCCMDRLVIRPPDSENPFPAIRTLVIFVRLWRTLRGREGCGTKITFALLADICNIFKLFNGETVNGEFIRQLSALLLLQEHFCLPFSGPQKTDEGNGEALGVTARGDGASHPLTGTTATTRPSGASNSPATVPDAVSLSVGDDTNPLAPWKRTKLLGIWAGPKAAPDEWLWAVKVLLDHIEKYAQKRYHCPRRTAEFKRIIADNLTPLSELAGFTDADSWFANPASTLRFAEVLSKIYASEYTVGQILFLFTTDDHLVGDDPFRIPGLAESLSDPLELPDDSPHGLWSLRDKLLNIECGDANYWTWRRIINAIHDLGFVAPAGMPDPLTALGEHFFPDVLNEMGISVPKLNTQYREPLAASDTNPAMWNTSNEDPFHYDIATEQLWISLPLEDDHVLSKLRHLRQLRSKEIGALRNLYFAPRAALAPFAAMFSDFGRAVELLVQETCERKRFNFFCRAFSIFYKSCEVIAEHIALQVGLATGCDSHVCDVEKCPSKAVSWHILRRLVADENLAKSAWEDDSGKPPVDFTWDAHFSGNGFAALLGLVGTGLEGQYDVHDTAAWRELRGKVQAFDLERNIWNAPIPTIVPSLELMQKAEQQEFVTTRNGFAIQDTNGDQLGGASPFSVKWKGTLAIEEAGHYFFSAGRPTPDPEEPGFVCPHQSRWLVVLKRGQKTWTLINHGLPEEDEAPPAKSFPVCLRRGVYHIEIYFDQIEPTFDDDDDMQRALTGFQVKYQGPDSHNRITTLSFHRVFREVNHLLLSNGLSVTGTAKQFLDTQYTSSLRDIRRTYQRAFKASLFAYLFNLSANSIHSEPTSELEYLLDHGADFLGTAYHRVSATQIESHHAYFDFNLLPVTDPYNEPVASTDSRVRPSPQRRAALFDWWERIFDYCQLRGYLPRRHTPWLLFSESTTQQPADANQLVRRIGVDLSLSNVALNFYSSLGVYTATPVDLQDERWAIRVWWAWKWIVDLQEDFFAQEMESLLPYLWSSNDPSSLVGAISGNLNLTHFVQVNSLEEGKPHRFRELELLDDRLRGRSRAALLAYLCGMNRLPLTPLVANTFAKAPRDITDLLLQDVEVGISERASRIEDGIHSVQTLVQRARLGLEPNFAISSAFVKLWDCRYASFDVWLAGKRREVYSENWIQWDELKLSNQSEGTQFLENELRRGTVTIPAPAVPGGHIWWTGVQDFPRSAPLAPIQSRDYAKLRIQNGSQQGLPIMGVPDRSGRPSWLAPLPVTQNTDTPPENPRNNPSFDSPSPPEVPRRLLDVNGEPGHEQASIFTPLTSDDAGVDEIAQLPLWIQAAIRLGTRFVRVAAAGEPPATYPHLPRTDQTVTATCSCKCGKEHAPVVDEYYFWLVDSRRYNTTDLQINADVGANPTANPTDPTSDWERDEKLPQLLKWDAVPLVYLFWTRVHLGSFDPARRSLQGLPIADTSDDASSISVPQLTFSGRTVDSLTFSVSGADTTAFTGYLDQSPAGFRYDLAADSAVTLPEVVSHSPLTTGLPVPLSAFPFFIYFEPGAPLVPVHPFSTALVTAGALRSHCKFESALKWCEAVFDPLNRDNTWVQCRQLRSAQNSVQNRAVVTRGAGRDTPCCPSYPVGKGIARSRAVLIEYLDTLLQWGDTLMCQNSSEAFQKATVVFNVAERILGAPPAHVDAHDTSTDIMTVDDFLASPAPINPRLISLYERVHDRRGLTHLSFNKNRQRNGGSNLDFAAWETNSRWDNWKTSMQDCGGQANCFSCCHPYRFLSILPKALELAGLVRGLGASLLAAFEKGDTEYMSAMRSTQDRQLLDLNLDNRKNQYRAAEWQLQSLQQTLLSAQTRLRYYQGLIQHGLNGGEIGYKTATDVANGSRTGGNVSEAASQAMSMILDLWFGAAGFGGTPLTYEQMPLGTKLAGSLSTAARILNSVAEIANSNGALSSMQGGWDRRAEEWQQQVDVIQIEIAQIKRQILGAERSREVALRDLNNHQQQIEHSAEVQEFMRDKFTTQALYLFLQQETAALYQQAYNMAEEAAQEVQQAFHYERGDVSHNLLPARSWSSLHEGLMAGERLELSLRTIEHAYMDTNCREYELTKQLSLRLHFPLAFLLLKTVGYCEIDIPEWMFDLDYPGHYMRRIKNVTLTLPCVTGPYTGIHCRLQLLSSSIRVDPLVSASAAGCCSTKAKGTSTIARDPHVQRRFAGTEAIATSSGQNDSGLFELRFSDDRYLPFEFAGAVSRWRIELPPENNSFDLDSLSDLILNMNYTAREGGPALRSNANDIAQKHLPGGGVRFFDVKHEFSDAWAIFQRNLDESRHRDFHLRLSRSMFPFLTGRRSIRITRIDLFIETDVPQEGEHIPVRYSEKGWKNDGKRWQKDGCIEDTEQIECLREFDHGCLYHGVLDGVSLGPLSGNAFNHLGTLRFPRELCDIREIFLLCCYEVIPQSSKEACKPGVPYERGLTCKGPCGGPRKKQFR